MMQIPLRAWIIPILAVLILIAVGVKARADDKPIDVRHQRPGKINCTVIRDFVAMVGEAEAEKVARNAGATDARIDAAKSCLKK